MEDDKSAVAARLRTWVAGCGLSKVDLAKKLDYPRNALYSAMNTGKISHQLYQSILREFPDTDMNWLLKGEAGNGNMVAEPVLPYSRTEKVRTATAYLEKDLVVAQNRVADQLERLGNLMEQFLKMQMK